MRLQYYYASKIKVPFSWESKLMTDNVILLARTTAGSADELLISVSASVVESATNNCDCAGKAPSR